MVGLPNTCVQAENSFHLGFLGSPDNRSCLDLRDRIALWPWPGTLPFMTVDFFLLLVL